MIREIPEAIGLGMGEVVVPVEYISHSTGQGAGGFLLKNLEAIREES